MEMIRYQAQTFDLSLINLLYDDLMYAVMSNEFVTKSNTFRLDKLLETFGYADVLPVDTNKIDNVTISVSKSMTPDTLAGILNVTWDQNYIRELLRNASNAHILQQYMYQGPSIGDILPHTPYPMPSIA